MNFLPILGIVLLLGIDQFTKYWAVNTLANQADIMLWPNVFHLSYVENRGAAFGMLQSKQGFFIIMTIAVLIFIVWYWKRIPKDKWGI